MRVRAAPIGSGAAPVGRSPPVRRAGTENEEATQVSASRTPRRPDAATEKLTGWIEPVVGASGYDLEELVVTPAGRRSVVRVVVDRDEGITLDDIAEVSKAVSDVLDAQGAGMGPPYVLEVTSPGVDRPLTEPRHWRRNVGRLVAVGVGPQGAVEQVTGRITDVDDAGVTLGVEAKGKPGARKRRPQPRRVPWEQLGAGRVQVEFGRADAEPEDAPQRTADEADDDGGEQ